MWWREDNICYEIASYIITPGKHINTRNVKNVLEVRYITKKFYTSSEELYVNFIRNNFNNLLLSDAVRRTTFICRILGGFSDNSRSYLLEHIKECTLSEIIDNIKKNDRQSYTFAHKYLQIIIKLRHRCISSKVKIKIGSKCITLYLIDGRLKWPLGVKYSHAKHSNVIYFLQKYIPELCT